MEDLSYLSSPDARRYMVESYNRESMTLSQQLRKLISLGEKHGLTDAVEFLKVFIKKQEEINAKQRINTQLPKDVRSNGSLPKVRTKKTRNVETEAGHEGT